MLNATQEPPDTTPPKPVQTTAADSRAFPAFPLMPDSGGALVAVSPTPAVNDGKLTDEREGATQPSTTSKAIRRLATWGFFLSGADLLVLPTIHAFSPNLVHLDSFTIDAFKAVLATSIAAVTPQAISSLFSLLSHREHEQSVGDAHAHGSNDGESQQN